MPAVAIVISSVGASLGTAAFAGTALAAYGGMIGAGIAGGMMSMSQGGDFGKGFLMGAVGNFVGGQIGGLFGGAATEGLSESAFQAADYANLAGQGLDAAAIGQNMGAAASNWGGVLGDISSGAASGLGDVASGTTAGLNEMNLTDSQFMNETGNLPLNTMNTEAVDSNVFNNTNTGEALAWDDYSGVQTPYNDAATINPQATYPGSNGPDLSSGLENVAVQPSESSVGDFSTGAEGPGFMDRMKGWVSDSDAKLAQFGMPKGSSVMGLAGIGQYMMGNYETYKAEQIAKGMRPLTLEEFQNKMYNSNDYKQAANSMAKSGRTGTLPTLLARMKQQSSMDYTKNYQPTANENWWNVNANISRQRTNNLGNLTQPLSMAWAMNQGKR